MDFYEIKQILGLPIGARSGEKTVTRELKEEAWEAWKKSSAAYLEIIAAPVGSIVGGQEISVGMKDWAIATLGAMTSAAPFVMNCDNFKMDEASGFGTEMWAPLPLRGESANTNTLEGFLCCNFGPKGGDIVDALPSSVQTVALIHNDTQQLDYFQFSLPSADMTGFLNAFFRERAEPVAAKEAVDYLYPANVVIFREGAGSPATPEEYYRSVVTQICGDRVLTVDKWRIVGVKESLTAEDASSLYRKMVLEDKIPYFGYEIERHRTVGPDGAAVAVLLFSMREIDSAKNPVCEKCGTVYNRKEVLRQLRDQSPELFDFPTWTTKFRCVKCGEVSMVSGTSED